MIVVGEQPMSIVYIHSVNVRDRAFGDGLKGALERWVAPAIASAASGPLVYDAVFWGDIASDFRWNLKSRPLTQVLGMGAETRAPSLARISPYTLGRARMDVVAPTPFG